MNILHLKYAVEVAKTHSISKAAENLYMGQPNLSRAIKELEESLGITIFNRTTKGITTTQDGDEFLEYAQKIVAQVNEVEHIYQEKRVKRQCFSVSVSGAFYISGAMAEFAKRLSSESPAEIYYKENSAAQTVNGVAREDFNLGIVRYSYGSEKYFRNLFMEKKLNFETIAEFSYNILVSKESPLADIKEITAADLKDYIEICQTDTYNYAYSEGRKAESPKYSDKHIYVSERSVQLVLLGALPNAFMWTSPVPEKSAERFGLTVKETPEKGKVYKDVLIYRSDYKLSDLDKRFITDVCNSERAYFKGEKVYAGK